MKEFIYRSLIGISIGAFIAVLITNMSILFGDIEMIKGSLFIKNSIGAIVCGWFFTVSPMYYKIEKLNFLQQTFIHFITLIILYHTLAFSIGWLPFNINNIITSLIIFIIHYIIFWSAFYLYYRNQAIKLNKGLENL